MKYNKLVRDKIPEIIKSRWALPVVHVADEKEYWESLKAKLLEETNEVLEDDNIEEELADLTEVIYAMLDFKWISINDLEKTRVNKKESRWWFKDRIILEETKE